MQDIQRRIAELEAELSRLREGLSSATDSSLKSSKSNEEITVQDVAELTLDGCPLFVRQLLDHLPVQVFFKKAQLVSNGREYLYINQKALSILGWESARRRFDSEAFEGGVSSSEWKAMIDIETETIASGHKSLHELQWTSPLGDEWRINNTIGVPVRQIGKQDSGNIVAFCAIAQDISFQQVRKANQVYLDILLHEYGNMCNDIISDITLGMRSSNGDQYFQCAVGRATVAKDIAYTLLKAFDPAVPTATETVKSIIAQLIELASRWSAIRLDLNIDEASLIHDQIFTNAEVVLAVLVQLIANAEKHTSAEFRGDGGVAMIELAVRENSSGMIEWSITNRCTHLGGRLDLSEKGRTATLGGSILGNIIRLAFKTSNPYQFVRFPERLGADHRVTVVFFHPLGAP